MAYYPREVFNINMDITRANMREYDKKREREVNSYLAINPNYFKLDARTQYEIRKQAKEQNNE